MSAGNILYFKWFIKKLILFEVLSLVWEAKHCNTNTWNGCIIMGPFHAWIFFVQFILNFTLMSIWRMVYIYFFLHFDSCLWKGNSWAIKKRGGIKSYFVCIVNLKQLWNSPLFILLKLTWHCTKWESSQHVQICAVKNWGKVWDSQQKVQHMQF